MHVLIQQPSSVTLHAKSFQARARAELGPLRHPPVCLTRRCCCCGGLGFQAVVQGLFINPCCCSPPPLHPPIVSSAASPATCLLLLFAQLCPPSQKARKKALLQALVWADRLPDGEVLSMRYKAHPPGTESSCG